MHAVVKSYVTAWNEHDTQQLQRCFARDGVYIDSCLSAEISGNAIVDHARKLFALYPDIHFAATEPAVQAGETIVLRWVMRGTNTGMLGGLPATNQSIALPGADFIRLVDDKIQSVQVYFNARLIPRQWRSYLLWCDAERYTAADEPPSEDSGAAKYSKSGLSDEDARLLKEKLSVLMERERLYLRRDLSLGDVARRLNCSTNHVSQVVNTQFGMNFYDFLGAYRVSAAKELLHNTDPSHRSVLDVALDVGYKSKSAFYRAFKRHTGMNPVEYQRR